MNVSSYRDSINNISGQNKQLAQVFPYAEQPIILEGSESYLKDVVNYGSAQIVHIATSISKLWYGIQPTEKQLDQYHAEIEKTLNEVHNLYHIEANDGNKIDKKIFGEAKKALSDLQITSTNIVKYLDDCIALPILNQKIESGVLSAKALTGGSLSESIQSAGFSLEAQFLRSQILKAQNATVFNPQVNELAASTQMMDSASSYLSVVENPGSVDDSIATAAPAIKHLAAYVNNADIARVPFDLRNDVIEVMKKQPEDDNSYAPVTEWGAYYGESINVPEIYQKDMNRSGGIYLFNKFIPNIGQGPDKERRIFNYEVVKSLVENFGEKAAWRIMLNSNQTGFGNVTLEATMLINNHFMDLSIEAEAPVEANDMTNPDPRLNFVVSIDKKDGMAEIIMKQPFRSFLKKDGENVGEAYVICKRIIEVPVDELNALDFDTNLTAAPNMKVTDVFSQPIMNDKNELIRQYSTF